MNEANLALLVHDIEAYLHRERPSISDRTPHGDTGTCGAYWSGRAQITLAEINMLAMLEYGPLCIDEMASILGRNRDSTRELVEALVAIGVVDRESGGYSTSPAAHLYLQMLTVRDKHE